MAVFVAKFYEQTSLTVMSRVYGHDGAAVTQASLSAITCKVFDMTTTLEVTPAPSVVIASNVYDALQTSDARWTADGTGYNFQCVIPAVNFPFANRQYRVEFWFTPTSGDPFPLVIDLPRTSRLYRFTS